jgi:ABC-type transporter Mla subunit MlaD
MDTTTIDQAYSQLQTEFQDVAQTVQALAQKLQQAADSGDQNAREWLLDLKGVALDIKDEQMQVNNLLSAIHGFVANANQAPPPQQVYAQPVQQQMYPQQAYPQQRRGGMFGNFLRGGFGQAMEMGAGIGLGEDLINSIF